MRRFYVPAESLSSDRITIDGALAHRMRNVLRLSDGDQVVLFDGSGEDTIARIESVRDRTVTAVRVGREPGVPEPSVAVHVYQSITKGERFEWLLEKATEIGVSSVTPLITARSVVKSGGEGSRADRWRRIVVEAAEQCGRSKVPAVAAPLRFDDALSRAAGTVLLPYEDAPDSAPSISGALGKVRQSVTMSEVSVLIGPEGGYEPSEVERAREAGATVVTMGRRVLRSETAGLVAATLVLQATGDLGARS